MALSPMMQQYQDAKRACPEALLLFRMGDFYELFYEDAVTAAKVLGLTLTSRDKGSANPIPMAGFPYHALDGYLHKLIHAGHKAAICDQVEDPKTAKGMVRREVTRIVTPGTLTDDALLDPRECNYLAAVVFSSRQRGTHEVGRSAVAAKNGTRSVPATHQELAGIAWAELSTGRPSSLYTFLPVCYARTSARRSRMAPPALLSTVASGSSDA